MKITGNGGKFVLDDKSSKLNRAQRTEALIGKYELLARSARFMVSFYEANAGGGWKLIPGAKEKIEKELADLLPATLRPNLKGVQASLEGEIANKISVLQCIKD